MDNILSTPPRLELPIVVLSCDKYSDLWCGFFQQLSKFLPINNKKYLVTNNKDFNSPKIKNLSIIKTGDDTDWSTNLLIALEKIPENKILIILEDIYLSEYVNLDNFFEIQKFVFNNNSQHIKIFSGPKATQPTSTPLIFKYTPGVSYLATINGIWDKATLKKILISGESAWQFEVNGSYRAQYFASKFYSINSDLIPHVNIVEKGKWIPSSVKWALANNIELDISKRKFTSAILYGIKKYYFNIVFQTPWKFRQNLINFLKKILICY